MRRSKPPEVAYSEDPTNIDPRFTRPRLRTLLPALASEGLDARGFARLAARMRRAELAIEFAVGAAREALAPGPWRERGPVVFETVAIREPARRSRAAPPRPRRGPCRK